jgi:hypothetical protein
VFVFESFLSLNFDLCNCCVDGYRNWLRVCSAHFIIDHNTVLIEVSWYVD